MEPSLNIRSFRIGNLVYNPHLERIGYIAEITRADMTLFHGEMLIKEAGFYHEILDKIASNRPEIGSAAKTNPTDTTWCMILFAPDAGGYIELSSNPELAAHNSCMTVGL